MTDLMYSKVLDEGVFRYYHSISKRSAILYIDDRIDLLEVNGLVKTIPANAEFSVLLEMIRGWVFKADDDNLTID